MLTYLVKQSTGNVYKHGVEALGRLTDSAPVTEPCPTCGKDAVAETLTVLRDGVTYRQTIWRCPSSRKKKKPTYTNRKFIRPACPVRKTEDVIEMPNPTGKNGRAASVRPNPQDIEEYHRLKEKLGLKNRVLKELSGVRDAAVYDWLAGRLVTEDVNARMMAALAQIRKNNLQSYWDNQAKDSREGGAPTREAGELDSKPSPGSAALPPDKGHDPLTYEVEGMLLEVGPLENMKKALGSGRPPAPPSGGVGFLPYDQIPTADEIGQWAKDGFAKTFGASDNAENIEQRLSCLEERAAQVDAEAVDMLKRHVASDAVLAAQPKDDLDAARGFEHLARLFHARCPHLFVAVCRRVAGGGR